MLGNPRRHRRQDKPTRTKAPSHTFSEKFHCFLDLEKERRFYTLCWEILADIAGKTNQLGLRFPQRLLALQASFHSSQPLLIKTCFQDTFLNKPAHLIVIWIWKRHRWLHCWHIPLFSFRDLVSNLAQPSRAWANPLEIPPLESRGKEARKWQIDGLYDVDAKKLWCTNITKSKILLTFRDEVFKLLNYIPDQSLVLWRGTQNLNTSNLLNYLKETGVKSVCEVLLGMFWLLLMLLYLVFVHPPSDFVNCMCIFRELWRAVSQIIARWWKSCRLSQKSWGWCNWQGWTEWIEILFSHDTRCFFFTGPPPKKLKYGKQRLGEVRCI